jgi:hypothetical protein
MCWCCAGGPGLDWLAGGGRRDRDRGDFEEVAGGAGQAAVGGESDQGGGEVGDGLDGEADRHPGGDAATGVDRGEAGGREEPGEP